LIKGTIAEKIKLYLAMKKCVEYRKLRRYADKNNIKPNTLYVTLHRLKEAGLIEKKKKNKKTLICITREFRDKYGLVYK